MGAYTLRLQVSKQLVKRIMLVLHGKIILVGKTNTCFPAAVFLQVEHDVGSIILWVYFSSWGKEKITGVDGA